MNREHEKSDCECRCSIMNAKKKFEIITHFGKFRSVSDVLQTTQYLCHGDCVVQVEHDVPPATGHEHRLARVLYELINL